MRTLFRYALAWARRLARSGAGVPVLVLVLFCASQAAWKVARTRSAMPGRGERIYAALVEWGVETTGLTPPVEQREVDRRIEELRSGNPEVRVRAAHWLAARGLRGAGERIAASMNDPGTLRPCQLAHSLGRLGDEKWTDELVRAAEQSSNADLRACAGIALSDLASSRAVDSLIRLTLEDPSWTVGVRALGETGDPRALEHLHWVRARTVDPARREAVDLAIDRVELLSEPDPLPDLLHRIEASVARGNPDEWALRHVARRSDQRAIPSLVRALTAPAGDERARELMAAALLAHGKGGRDALASLRTHDFADVRRVTGIALALESGRSAPRPHAARTLGSSGVPAP